jgi:membrane-associated phospholipid phosphatase
LSFEREHDEVMWAVEPEVGDGVVTLPQPGGIALPGLVREPKPLTQKQIERRERRAATWGAPRADLDRRTLTIALLALACSLGAAMAVFGMSLTTDRYLVVLFVPALVLGRGRIYLRDFGIFALLFFGYSELRGLTHIIQPQPFYTPQLTIDKWLFGGHVPTVELQKWWWTGSMHWYDHLLIDVSDLHFVVPPLLGFALWLKRRALFFRFTTSILTLSLAAALTFLLFPAAPPWAAGRTLLTPTVTKITDNTWSQVGSSFSLSKIIKGNPYAAIPSLHAGYAMLCFLFVASLVWRKRWRWWVIVPAAVYPLALSFARVYTGDHYVIDLIAGYLYAIVAFYAVNRYWRRNELPQ